MELSRYVSFTLHLRRKISKLPCPAFGFAAALLESVPILGLFFSVSNRIGAAMWAHGMGALLSPSKHLFNNASEHWQTWKNANMSFQVVHYDPSYDQLL